MRGCGTLVLPEDGTPEREAVDRFRDFLALVGAAGVDPRDWRMSERSAAQRYRLRYAVWAMSGDVSLLWLDARAEA